MANPRLSNLYRADAGHQFAFGMVTIAYDHPLSCIAPPFSICFQVLGHFVLNRRLQQLPGSFREQLFQVALGFIFGSLFERNHFTLNHWCILSFGASSEHAVSFCFTERMRLSLFCHPQLSVIAPPRRRDALPRADRWLTLRAGVRYARSGLGWKVLK